MAELNFDDLIPKDGKGVSFDDLVPQAAPSQGVWDTIKTQAGNFGQAADDIARIVANHASLGYADKLASYMNGTPLEQERAASKAADDRAGWAGTAAGVLGSMGPWGAVSKGLGAAGMASPYLNAAATGAITGTGDAAGNDRNLLEGAGIGAASGIAGNALAKGLTGAVDKVAGAFNKAPSVMSSADLQAAKSAAYKTADEAGGWVNQSAMQRLVDALRGNASEVAATPRLQPYAFGAINEANNIAKAPNVTMQGLDTLRKVAGRAYDSQLPGDSALGRTMKGTIDDFTANLKPGDYIEGMGDPAVANAAYGRARELATRAFKDQELNDAVKHAELVAMSTGSGGNVNNATRQAARRLYENGTAWTPDEKAALERVIQGTPWSNTSRLLGKMSPEGNGLMMALGTGATLASHGASVAPAMAGGFISKRIADALTQRNVSKLGELIRAGGDASALQAPPNAVQLAAQKSREALARALMGGGVSYGVPALAEQQ